MATSSTEKLSSQSFQALADGHGDRTQSSEVLLLRPCMLESPMPEPITKHNKKMFHDAPNGQSLVSLQVVVLLSTPWPSGVHTWQGSCSSCFSRHRITDRHSKDQLTIWGRDWSSLETSLTRLCCVGCSRAHRGHGTLAALGTGLHTLPNATGETANILVGRSSRCQGPILTQERHGPSAWQDGDPSSGRCAAKLLLLKAI